MKSQQVAVPCFHSLFAGSSRVRWYSEEIVQYFISFRVFMFESSKGFFQTLSWQLFYLTLNHALFEHTDGKFHYG